jgi:phage regulator Rha-like protein
MSKQVTFLAKRAESRILSIRSTRVILDADLAELYGVSTKRLNEQVKRNARRFPDDFMFQLNVEELADLRSQIVTSSSSHGGRRYRPYAFTEHGVIMAASILNSERADEMSLFVVRAFIRMREALAANQQIIAKLSELERKVEGHDSDIQDLIEAIRQLMEPPPASNRRIGFALSAGTAKESSRRR